MLNFSIKQLLLRALQTFSVQTFSVLSLVNIILETKILIFLDLILYCMVNTLLDILDPFYGTS